MALLRADGGTFSAVCTVVYRCHQLRAGRKTFRIVAPCTAQRTAFKKYGGPDAVAIVKRKFLDVENSACRYENPSLMISG